MKKSHIAPPWGGWGVKIKIKVKEKPFSPPFGGLGVKNQDKNKYIIS